MGFEKVLIAVKVIKDQIQYRSQSLLNLARGYFRWKVLLFLTTDNFMVKDKLTKFVPLVKF